MSRPNLAARAAAVLIAAAASAGAFAQSQPRYGVCRDQIVDYVQKTLGQTVVRVDIMSYSERWPPRRLLDPGNALVYVKECDGYHSFEIRATWEVCETLPHYGTPSSMYTRYEGAFEGCAKQ